MNVALLFQYTISPNIPFSLFPGSMSNSNISFPSASRAPLLLHPPGRAVRGDAGLEPQHHLRGRGLPDALRQVEEEHSAGPDAGARRPYRQERPASARRPGERQLHVRRGVQAGQHRGRRTSGCAR